MKELLGEKVEVVIDRPLGSVNPNHGTIYPVNYGFLPKTFDHEKEIKAYVLGEFEPLKSFTGYVIAVIHRVTENVCKLVVTKEKKQYSKEQIEALIEFKERFHQSKVITE
ncbi:MAG: inorganic pyrophosphatase [Bacillota bacterium]